MSVVVIILGPGALAGTIGPCPQNPGKEKQQQSCGAVRGAEHPSVDTSYWLPYFNEPDGKVEPQNIHPVLGLQRYMRGPFRGHSEGKLTSILGRKWQRQQPTCVVLLI